MPAHFSSTKRTARIFLDTEFTSFINPQLLSLALVLDDECDFYGELNVPAFAREENDFVDENVLSQWGKAPTAFSTRADMATALSDWLHLLDAQHIEVHYDYHTDMDLMEALLVEAGLWATWAPALIPTHVGYLYGDDRTEEFMALRWDEQEARTGLKAHHALSDARVLRQVFLMVHDGVGA